MKPSEHKIDQSFLAKEGNQLSFGVVGLGCVPAPVYRRNPKHPFAEKTAYQLGFRVSAEGQILRNGEPVHMVPNSNGYPGFTTRLPTGRRFISAHRLQAFQKFGVRIFEVGIEVRHLDGNEKNAAASNIAIGSHSDNMMDRPKEVRQRLDHEQGDAQLHRARGGRAMISRLLGSVVNLFYRRVDVVLRLCRLDPRSVKRARRISEGVR